jgi:uncharacterized protein
VKLHAAGPATYNTITAYGEDYVQVNSQRYQSSLIVMPETVQGWSAADFSGLRKEDFENLKNLGAEILLLGTGPKQRFPHPSLTAPLAQAGIGVEVMDLKAACRTYNILAAEARKVAAALLFK